MDEGKDKVLNLDVRLKSREAITHPRAMNYTNVGVAQGIAYVNFGFIDPLLLMAIATTAKNGQTTPMVLMCSLLCVWRWA